MSAFDEVYLGGQTQAKKENTDKSAFDSIYLAGNKQAPAAKPPSRAQRVKQLQDDLLRMTAANKKQKPRGEAVAKQPPQEFFKSMSSLGAPPVSSRPAIPSTADIAATLLANSAPSASPRTTKQRIEGMKQRIRDAGFTPESVRAEIENAKKYLGMSSRQAANTFRDAMNVAMKQEGARGQRLRQRSERFDTAARAAKGTRDASTVAAALVGAYALTPATAAIIAANPSALEAVQRMAVAGQATEAAIRNAPWWQQLIARGVQGAPMGAIQGAGYSAAGAAADNKPVLPAALKGAGYGALIGAGAGVLGSGIQQGGTAIGQRRAAGLPLLGKTPTPKEFVKSQHPDVGGKMSPKQFARGLEAVRRMAGKGVTPLQESIPNIIRQAIQGTTSPVAPAIQALTGAVAPIQPPQAAQAVARTGASVVAPSGPAMPIPENVVSSVATQPSTPDTRPQAESRVSMGEGASVRPVTGQAEGTGASVEGNNNVLGIQEVSPQEIQADPFRFQYKTGTGQGGATGLLHEVKKWQPELSGVMLAWKDPANGQTYIVNGHHRLDLAKRLNVPSVAVRYIDAATAEDARTIGAVANIAEGRGTAVDAAKVFRDADLSADDLQDMGVSLKEKMAADGLALSRLHPMLFGAVARGEMGTSAGVAIGNALSNHEDQIALVRLMEKSGKKLSAKEITELVSFVSNAAKQTQTEISLFGEEEAIQNLAVEKAQLAAYIKDRLSKDRRLFGYVAKTDRARELQRVGHIDANKSSRIASEAAKLEDVFGQQLHYAGPVSDALNQAAREMAAGGNINEIREGLYKRVRETLRAVFAGTEAEYYPTDKGTEGTGSVAAGQAGLFDGGEGGQLTPPQEIKQPALVSKAEPKPKEEVKPKPKPVKQPAVKQDKDVAKMVNVLKKRGVEVHGETKEMPNDIDAFAGESTIDYPDTVEKENTADSRPIRASDIVKDLQAAFVPIRTGRFRLAKTLGIYKSRGEVIRTRVANDLPTIAHEVGHHLQKLFFQNKRGALKDSSIPKEFRAELKPLAYKGAKKQAVEGYAEFVRMYLTGPEKAKQAAPTFYQFFEAKLSEYPNIQKALSKAQSNIRLWREQPAAARVRSTISRNEPGYKRPVTSSSLYTQWIDNLRPLEEAVKGISKGEVVPAAQDPFREAWLGRGVAGKAETWLEHGVTDKAGKKIGKSLREILAPVSEDLDAFGDYAVSRHALDVLADGKAMPLKASDYQAVVDAAPAQYADVLADLVSYQDALLNELVDSGLISQDAKDAMRKKWPNHVPLYRVYGESGAAGAGRTMANLPSAVKRLKGSGRDVIDVLESIVGDTYKYISLAQRNRVLQKLTNLADSHEGSAAYVEKVAAPMAGTKVTLREVLGIEQHDPVWLLLGRDATETANVFRPVYAPAGKENIVAVWKDGKQQYYLLEPELYRTVMSLDVQSSNTVIDLLSAPASLLRAGATLTPEFAIRNPIRDIGTAMVNSEYGFTPVDFFRGLFHMVGKTDLYNQWKAMGGAHAALVSADRNYLQNSVRKMQARKPSDGVLDVFLHPIEALRAISELTESATRVAEFGKGTGWGKENNLSKIVEAAISSRDVTLDFSRSGTAGKQMNRAIAFWNANVQGLNKQYRTFKARPTRSLVRSVAYFTVPTLLLYMLNRKDERYRRLPEWEKDVFWIIPTPKYLVRIPRPHLLGHLFATVPERIMRYIDEQDASAFDDLARNMWEANGTGVIPTALLPIVDVKSNRSFSGAPIVPEREKRLPKELQYGPRTTTTALVSGRLTKQSPRNIDYLIRGYTGGLGGYVAQGIGAAMEAAGLEKRPPRPSPLLSDYPVAKAFLHNEWSSSADVERLYKEKEALDRKAAGTKMGGPALTGKEELRAEALKIVDERLSNTRKFMRMLENAQIAPDDKRDYMLNLRRITDDYAALAIKGGDIKGLDARLNELAMDVLTTYPGIAKGRKGGR